MDNDYTIKVIFISVSLFVTMLVLTLVLNYYNVAKEISKQADLRVDIADSFDFIMKNQDTIEDIVSGAELQSLIRKYANDPYVTMNIIAISDDVEAEGLEDNINHTWYDSSKGIIKDTMLSKINPSWRNKIEKVVNGKYITLNLLLDYGLDE